MINPFVKGLWLLHNIQINNVVFELYILEKKEENKKEDEENKNFHVGLLHFERLAELTM